VPTRPIIGAASMHRVLRGWLEQSVLEVAPASEE
jgi:hypothetical protein